jgi:2,4-dienoyl-CoA reductase-like NADH-dependent reductase (Old Yellow Enzyme family)
MRNTKCRWRTRYAVRPTSAQWRSVAAAESILTAGSSDLAALARGALEDPNWPVHARHELGGGDDPYGYWPRQVGHVMGNKDRELGLREWKLDSPK